MKQKQSKFALFMAIFFGLNTLLLALPRQTSAAPARSLIFPVIGSASYSNDYYAPRGSGIHEAIDIIANKRQLLVAAVAGTIVNVTYPQPSWGYSISIRDSAGYTYTYIHINDDTPGTNDGRGGAMNAYAPDVDEGNVVVAGQFIGWVGDSGNSNGVPHLHFEMEGPGNQQMNPYTSLQAARRISTPVLHPQMPNEIMPFKANSKVGASVAMGNFDADPASEIVVGGGVGNEPRIKIYDDDNTYLRNFFAYPTDFKGGVDVGTGDLDGDGIDEIITGAGPGGGPHVRAFTSHGVPVAGFMAYGASFKGGVNVDGGDIDGDGSDEIITGAGAGGGPHVRAFDSTGTVVANIMAYAPEFTGGVDVTSADVTGDASDEIITGPGFGGSPRVRVFSSAGTVMSEFYSYATSRRKGVRVSAANVRAGTAKAEIYTVEANNNKPEGKLFTYDGTKLDEEFFLEEWWVGRYDVAAGFMRSVAASGYNRRATVREGL